MLPIVPPWLPLAEFVQYLQVAGLGDDAVTLYTSTVRTFLRHRKDTTQPVTLEELTAHVQGLTPPLRSRFRAAWSRFCDFARSQGRDMVMLDKRQVAQLSVRRYPILVRHLPGFLKDSRLKPRQVYIIKATQTKIDPESGDIYFSLKDRKWGTIEYRLPGEKTADFWAIFKWSHPEYEARAPIPEGSPLIPDAPGSRAPLRLGVLEAILRFVQEMPHATAGGDAVVTPLADLATAPSEDR